MLADKQEVLNYIPQREPMVMVDGLLEVDDEFAISRLQITPENIFCQNGHFTEPGLIENMAQTAALQNGFITIRHGGTVHTGFIGAVKKLNIFDLPADKDLINTTIRVIHNYENVTIIKAEVSVGGQTVAESEMSIFIRD